MPVGAFNLVAEKSRVVLRACLIMSMPEGQAMLWTGPMPGQPQAEAESQATVHDGPSPDRTQCYPPSVADLSNLSPQPEVGESPARALENGRPGPSGRMATWMPCPMHP